MHLENPQITRSGADANRSVLFGHVQNAEGNAFGDRLVMRIPQEHVE